MPKIIGIDYGEKRIGVSLSDEGQKFAFPYVIVKNSKGAFSEIKKICEKENAGKIVIGESLDKEGKENPIMKKIQEFAEELSTQTKLPIFYEKEFLTSVEAHRSAFKEQGKKGRQEIDASAAALILQRYLDRQK